MDIGIGIPNPVPGASGTELVAFARRAEERGFAGLATIDRVAFPTHDSLITLAAAAGATSRINLLTNILLAPVYPPVLLAKATGSLDQLSGGRLTLGLAPGGREDDYALAGPGFHTRGRDFDATLNLLHRAWRGERIDDVAAVSPMPVRDQRVPMLIGGSSDAAMRRLANWGDGWTSGGGGVEMASRGFDMARAAWANAGRKGEPRLAALAYYSLGEDAEQSSRDYLRSYYGFLGDYTDMIVEGALRSPEAIRSAVSGYADGGCTELYLVATVARVDQADRLADVVL
jgi:alkanesulfonate monooxygenase SsuD/methylene tetrahydromethanopterin reductase-like flavin-dependent oxidoreductase (luciferase family)